MSAGYEYDYQIERDRKREIYLSRIRNNTRNFLNKYENTLKSIENHNLVEFVDRDFHNAKNKINEANNMLDSDPERARVISQDIGSNINTMFKKGQERRKIYNQQEKQRKADKEKREKLLQKEFVILLDEQLLNLKDPIVRDYAIDDMYLLIDNMKKENINQDNFTSIKNELIKQSAIIIENAYIKADEFNKKYFQEIDENIEKEIILEQIEEKKKEIERIASDNPEKLKSLMGTLLNIKANINSSHLNSINSELQNISNDIINEEVNEEYRKHTVKAIFEILGKLGFTPTKPKKKNGEVVLKAQRLNGNNFEAIIKIDGSMSSHFDGYSYDACKDDIENLEIELQDCYGIDLKKTKTLWQNPDRIEKDAKPISELNRQG